jgi:D,D-heptose 1,7-bisphosphate phosphatase
VLQNLSKYNISKIYIIAGHKGNLIKKRYQHKYQNLVPIECIVEKKSLGTAYALNYVKKKIKNDFILMNGDTFVDFNLNYFLKNKINKNLIGCMILTKDFKKSLTSNLLNLDLTKNKLVKFSNKKKFISAGVIFFKRKLLKSINYKTFSIEKDILNKLIIKKKIKGIEHEGLFIDIGTPKNYILAKSLILKYFNKPAIFLDRDGVINIDKGYTYKIKDFKIQKNIIKILKRYKNTHYFFILTNQSGIARGFYKTNDFFLFQKHIKNYFSEKEIFIHDFEFCPHHIDGKIKKYKIICKCRKPNNLMIIKIKKRWPVNIKKSFFIGNNLSDKMCADKSNIKYFRYTADLHKKLSL